MMRPYLTCHFSVADRPALASYTLRDLKDTDDPEVYFYHPGGLRIDPQQTKGKFHLNGLDFYVTFQELDGKPIEVNDPRFEWVNYTDENGVTVRLPADNGEPFLPTLTPDDINDGIFDYNN